MTIRALSLAVAGGLRHWPKPAGNTAVASPESKVATAKELARRKIIDDIADFILTHDLEVTDVHLAVTRAYFEGDEGVVMAIEAALRAGKTIDSELLRSIWKSCRNELDPELVGRVAERLATKLAECLRIVGAASSSARLYGDAIAVEARGFEADPVGAFERLHVLTRDLLDATRRMEEQLEQARREASKLRTSLSEARREADRDHLTGLINRRRFDLQLGDVAQSPDRRVSLVALCDIDNFKQINDEHGHEAGDRVLQYIAKFLSEELGRKTIVARYGGEEFACLFEGLTPGQAFDLLDDARERLAARSLINKKDQSCFGTLSFSAGLVPIGANLRATMRAADDALYRAKRGGKGQVVAGEVSAH